MLTLTNEEMQARENKVILLDRVICVDNGFIELYIRKMDGSYGWIDTFVISHNEHMQLIALLTKACVREYTNNRAFNWPDSDCGKKS